MAATVGPGRPSDASFLFHGVEEKTPLLGRGHRDDDGRTEEPKNPGFDREAFSRLLAIVKLLSRSRVIVAAYSALFILTAVTECVVYFVGMRISLFFQYLLLRNLEGFLANTGILLGAFMLLAVLKGCSRLSGGFFALEARRKLSEMLQVSLVSPDNLYRITKTQPFSTVVDNPDQRICQDVDKLTAQLRTVLEALVITPLTIAFYTFMVWRVGGWLGPAIIYLFYAISGLVSYGLMAPLVPLIFRKDRAEGDYRYLHVHVRDYSETISLEGGNLAEQNALDDALYRVLDVQRSVVWRDSILSAGLAVLASMGGILCYVIVAIPVLVTHEYDDVPADKLSQIISLQTFTCIYLSSKLTGILNQAQEITDLAGYANRLGTLWESMSNGDPKNKACLICIDGWGISPKPDATGDAIRNAQHPVMAGFAKEYPNSVTEVEAHGLFVGLPEGLMGNSEDIVRIDLSIKQKKLGEIKTLVEAFDYAKANTKRVHFAGLISDGGVHSHIDHLFALLDCAKQAGVPEAYVHFFGDGRDTAPRSSETYCKQLLEYLESIHYGKLATIVGRYYAMDRDKRWERVKVAYEMLTQGIGEKVTDPLKAIEERYAKDETDEFLKPIVVDEQGIIKDNDVLIFFNYRSDRMREINQAFGVPPIPFETKVQPKVHQLTMTQYNEKFPFPVVFGPQRMDNVLGEWLSKHGLAQCHIAETEKYAHVTFFFNGGQEKQFEGEERDLIPSPKVATYDLKPEMSCIEVAQKTAERLNEGKHPFIILNFAPPDMVGHTGVYEAAVKAVEATDKAIGIVYEACKKNGYTLFITADHGNAEKMISDDGKEPFTAHTTARVPFIMTSNEFKFQPGKIGALCDVAPTILAVMGLAAPEEMEGTSLLAQ
ncbi:hypothetical protein DFJ74DRAFT_732131 [Hyaloraphidium curvatum]|nr:hypothetical protein DFJ74DRAFT_732131 [Hyaloraphidium curvatum]